jgi:hypothetical protein
MQLLFLWRCLALAQFGERHNTLHSLGGLSPSASALLHFTLSKDCYIFLRKTAMLYRFCQRLLTSEILPYLV